MVITKAALPILAGAATVALRFGWKLLQQRLADAATSPISLTKMRSAQPAPLSTRPRRTVRIRSTWAVGDANGLLQQGTSDHTIEFDD